MEHECDKELRIHNIENTIYGNGREGLKEKMTKMEELHNHINYNIVAMQKSIEKMEDSQFRNKADLRWIIRINSWVLGVVTTIAAGIITAIVTGIIK